MPNMTLRVSDCVAYFDAGLTVEGYEDFGLNEYPIFNEAHREILNAKIVDHFFNYEIGQETFSQFRLSLKRRMNEIMPLYNQLYTSTEAKFDPLVNMDYSEAVNSVAESAEKSRSDAVTNDKTVANTKNVDVSNSDTDAKTTTDNKARTVNSMFPQQMLKGNQDYATSAADSVGTTVQDATTHTATRADGTMVADTTSDGTQGLTAAGEGKQTVDSSRSIKGRQGSPADMLRAWRETFLNVDMQVIGELENLFSGIWDSGNNYTNNERIGYYGFGFGYYSPFGL